MHETGSEVRGIQTGFADIHTHILPGIDDGAKDREEALKMVRLAWQSGTKVLFLTPHYRGVFKKHTPDYLRESFASFCHTVHEEFPEMQLVLGQEVHYQTDIPERLSRGRVLTMGESEYVLLEFRGNSLRAEIVRGVVDVVRCGYTPIVAHAERYDAFRRDFSLVREVLGHGALLQLNADSVLGKHGFFVKRFCHKVLKQENAHFIASDAHETQMRVPVLEKCFSYVKRKYGEDYAARLFYRNAQVVMESKIHIV